MFLKDNVTNRGVDRLDHSVMWALSSFKDRPPGMTIFRHREGVARQICRQKRQTEATARQAGKELL